MWSVKFMKCKKLWLEFGYGSDVRTSARLRCKFTVRLG